MTVETVTITDSRSGSSAAIAVGYGFNCFRFTAMPGAVPREVLWSHPQFISGKERPSGSGIPLMFPFAGRLRGEGFDFLGQRYPLSAGDGRGNAIHGFVMHQPWRVIERTAAAVTGQFQASVDDASLLPHWPADFRITVRYAVEGNTLASQITVDNPCSAALPFGFGTHPYFRVPGPASAALSDCRVTVPAQRRWELRDLLPTGRILDYPDARLRTVGLPLGATQFDDAFTSLEFYGSRCTARIDGLDGGGATVMSFDDAFRECVVYNPPHREAICIEPYTTMPDAFWLMSQGIDAGLRLLPPGASWRSNIEIHAV